MMNVVWMPDAADDMDAMFDFYAEKDKKFIARIWDCRQNPERLSKSL